MNKQSQPLTFKQIVAATGDISKCYQVGLRGLGTHSNKVKLHDTTKCTGSVDLDTGTTAKYPNANRWDYFFCYKGQVYFVEVHGAKSDEVSTVIKKLKWLKEWLNNHATEINKIKAKTVTPYYWVQSHGFHIPRNSPQFRQAAQNGILPVAVVNLE